MIFAIWRMFSFVWVFQMFKVLRQELALHGNGIPVDLSKLSRQEILDEIRFCQDETTKAVLQSYL